MANQYGVSIFDGRGSWRLALKGQPGLVAWPARDQMWLAAVDGELHRSNDGRRTWRRTGSTRGAPVALYSTASTILLAAEDGSIYRSSDSGANWTQLLQGG